MPPESTPKRWLSRLDRWFIFTPAQWPHRELISRATALLIIVIFLALRIDRFDRFPQSFEAARLFYASFKTASGAMLYSSMEIAALWGVKLSVWVVETFIYLGYIASYTSRAKAINIAEGFMEVAYPIIVAGLPIIMSFMPYSLPGWLPYASQSHGTFYLVIMAMIVIGGLLNLIGLLTMRKAFSIMAEARTLITGGIFRYIRHPLYTGHFIMFSGSMLLRMHWVTLILYSIFIFGQIYRAGIEERKMLGTFHQYEQYRQRTGMFLPKFGSFGSGEFKPRP